MCCACFALSWDVLWISGFYLEKYDHPDSKNAVVHFFENNSYKTILEVENDIIETAFEISKYED